MAERKPGDLASAMYPSLSREAREREDAAAQHRVKQKMRNQQLAADLKALNARMREREGRR
jgi:hypothetical protein